MEKKMMVIVICVVLTVALAGIHGVSEVYTIVLNGSTHIIGRDGLCLDVIGGFNDDHIPTQLWPCGDGSNQLWAIQTNGTIQSMGKCLALNHNYAGAYTMIDNCESSSSGDKTWKLNPDGTLSHVYSGLVLTAPTAGEHPITTIENNAYAATQKWKTGDIEASIVTLIVGLRGLCLEAQNDNVHVWLSKCVVNLQRQKWASYGDGTIRANYDRAFCLSYVGENWDDATIVLDKCEESSKQRWVRKDDTILSLKTRLVMDVKGNNPDLNQIILWRRTGKANQHWEYVP